MARRENLSTVILALAGASVVIALAVLLVKVRARPSPPIDEAAVARAAQRHHQPAPAPAPEETKPSPPRPHIPSPALPVDRGARPTPPEYEDGVGPPLVRMRGGSLAKARAAAEAADPGQDQAGLAQAMQAANALYDRADYEGAHQAALDIVAKQPDNVRMLRIVVSSACILGDADSAKQYYGKLPARDQRQLSRRCARYGIEF